MVFIIPERSLNNDIIEKSVGPTASIMLQEHAMATYAVSLVDVKLTRNNKIPNLLSLAQCFSFLFHHIIPHRSERLVLYSPHLTPNQSL